MNAPALLLDTDKHTAQRIVWMRFWTPSLFSFRISRAAGYAFVPGQFARLGVPRREDEMVWRAYSICSGPAEDTLEFFSVVVPDGHFSSRLARYQVGDTVLVERKAQGFLTADRFYRGEGPKDLWLLCTGTGLGPYLSILKDPETWQRFETIVVVHSVRQAAELAYADQLRAWCGTPPLAGARARLRYVATVTREPPPAASALHPVLQGRITTLIESGALAAAADLPLSDARSRFMLCGNPQMVDDTRQLLKAHGFRNDRKLEAGHIAVENYW